MKKNQDHTGFTLIEILIALAVFAILSTITASAMYNSFTTRARLNKEADRLATFQLAFTLIRRDLSQAIDRPVRDNRNRPSQSFIGMSNYLEVTRRGLVNLQQSNLQRIAYLCTNSQLIRRSFTGLDHSAHQQYNDTIIIDKLLECTFSYLNKTLEVLPQWRENSAADGIDEPLPKAVKMDLRVAEWGTISLLLPTPEGIYALQP